MAYLLGLKPSPPDEWYEARLAKQINRVASEIPAEGWAELATLQEMEWMIQAQTMLTTGHGHTMGADSLLLLKRLRDEAKKEWAKN